MKKSAKILKFEKLVNVKLEYIDGKWNYSGSLNLEGCTGLTSLPDNLTCSDSIDLEGCTGLTSLPDNLTCGGSLYLRGCTGLTSLPDNLTCGGYLDLEGCTGLTSLPDNLTCSDAIDLRGCTGLTSLPDNLTCGGYLYLRGCTGLTSLPDNLTCGGSLNLEGCTGLTSLPDNLTCGGDLYFRGTQIKERNYTQINPDNYLFTWQNGKYIKCDELFCEVVQKKGNAFRVKEIGNSKKFYVVTDGKGKFAHGDTIKEAKEDLIFKIQDRDKSDFESLTLESKLTFKDAIECYRVITGACSFGTKDFVKNQLVEPKKEYTISEIIIITNGAYGNSMFKNFFSN